MNHVIVWDIKDIIGIGIIAALIAFLALAYIADWIYNKWRWRKVKK